MAKQRRKQEIVRGEYGQGHLVEEVFDDNLLPDAPEIERLHRLDPNIMEFLKNSAQKEQEFRHRAFEERVTIVKNADKGDRWINFWD